MNINLTQEEADALISMDKKKVDSRVWTYPSFGGSLSVPLISTDSQESFILDLHRARINLTKNTYQNRGRKVVVLVRLDLGGSPHRNPDGVKITGPHLHLFREGFGDKWASPLPSNIFTDLSNTQQVLDEFMNYCSIVDPPDIEQDLFS